MHSEDLCEYHSSCLSCSCLPVVPVVSLVVASSVVPFGIVNRTTSYRVTIDRYKNPRTNLARMKLWIYWLHWSQQKAISESEYLTPQLWEQTTHKDSDGPGYTSTSLLCNNTNKESFLELLLRQFQVMYCDALKVTRVGVVTLKM